MKTSTLMITKCIMLSERSQTQKATECIIPYTQGDIIRTEDRLVVWVGLRGGADNKGAAGLSFGEGNEMVLCLVVT